MCKEHHTMKQTTVTTILATIAAVLGLQLAVPGMATSTGPGSSTG